MRRPRADFAAAGVGIKHEYNAYSLGAKHPEHHPLLGALAAREKTIGTTL